MKFWHYQLIPFLTTKQLLSQWKRLDIIFKFKLCRRKLYQVELFNYSAILIGEMKRRNISLPDMRNFSNFFPNTKWYKSTEDFFKSNKSFNMTMNIDVITIDNLFDIFNDKLLIKQSKKIKVEMLDDNKLALFNSLISLADKHLPIYKSLKELSFDEYCKRITSNCKLRSGQCEHCIFKDVQCDTMSLSCWLKHKQIYSKKFLSQEVCILKYDYPNKYVDINCNITFDEFINTKAYLGIVCNNKKQLDRLNEEIKKRNLKWEITTEFRESDIHTNYGSIINSRNRILLTLPIYSFFKFFKEK